MVSDALRTIKAKVAAWQKAANMYPPEKMKQKNGTFPIPQTIKRTASKILKNRMKSAPI